MRGTVLGYPSGRELRKNRASSRARVPHSSRSFAREMGILDRAKPKGISRILKAKLGAGPVLLLVCARFPSASLCRESPFLAQKSARNGAPALGMTPCFFGARDLTDIRGLSPASSSHCYNAVFHTNGPIGCELQRPQSRTV